MRQDLDRSQRYFERPGILMRLEVGQHCSAERLISLSAYHYNRESLDRVSISRGLLQFRLLVDLSGHHHETYHCVIRALWFGGSSYNLLDQVEH